MEIVYKYTEPNSTKQAVVPSQQEEINELKNGVKKYEASIVTKMLSLGIKKYGARIISGEILRLGLFKKVLIDDIDEISFDKRYQDVNTGQRSDMITSQIPQYFYIITDKKGKEFRLAPTLLEGVTYQELLRDLIKLNPQIALCELLKDFLSYEIKKKRLKFDFNTRSIGEAIKQNKEDGLRHPSLGCFFALIAFFIIILCAMYPLYFIFEVLEDNTQWYRVFSFAISGLALMFAVINLSLFSLASMYLGHKKTIIALIIAVLGLCVGIL